MAAEAIVLRRPVDDNGRERDGGGIVGHGRRWECA